MKKVLIHVFWIFAVITASTAHADKIWVIPKPDSSLADKSVNHTVGFQIEKPESLEAFASSRIVGGTTAGRNDYPEFAQLFVDGSAIGLDPNFIYALCGASLISTNKVLTAAHCTIDFSAFNLYVVPRFYSFNDSLSSNDIIQVSVKAVHPGYSSTTSSSDVSVLTLISHANTALASIYAGSNQLSGFTSTVIGTGLLSEDGSAPATLQKVNVPVVSNAVCANSYASAGVNINNTMLCAGLAGGGLDSCQGDSGGPLWITFEGQKAQAGVVSFGIGCARPNFYGVYARTSTLINFIQQHAPTVKIVTSQAPVSVPVIAPMVDLLLN